MDQILEFPLCEEITDTTRAKLTVPKSSITGIADNTLRKNSCVVHIGLSTKYYVQVAYETAVRIVYGNDITHIPETPDE